MINPEEERKRTDVDKHTSPGMGAEREKGDWVSEMCSYDLRESQRERLILANDFSLWLLGCHGHVRLNIF